jgi:hypothetical protein
MKFTTGGAIVLAGEARNTSDDPSTMRSHTDSHGLCRRRSKFSKGSQQQEQDEVELNPYTPDRSASATRTSDDDDGHGSTESCVASQGGIHVSRQYEVSTEGTKNKSETRNGAFPSTSEVVVTSNGNF